MFKSLFLVVIFALASLIAAIPVAEKNPIEIGHHRHNVTGHLDCTAYYKPCAIDCSRRYLTPYQTLLGLVNAINTDGVNGYERLFNLFDPNVVIPDVFGTDLVGVCQIISGIIDLLPESWHVEIDKDLLDGPANSNFAQQSGSLIFLDGVVLKYTLNFSAVLVKNACNNWVYTLANVEFIENN